MNIDGAEVEKGSKHSIWPILLVINELPLGKRYSFENIIIGGLWSRSHKPSRNQMQSFLSPLVEELSQLEQIGISINDQQQLNKPDAMVKVFLINIAEPTAEFGCERCEFAGERLLVFEKDYN